MDSFIQETYQVIQNYISDCQLVFDRHMFWMFIPSIRG